MKRAARDAIAELLMVANELRAFHDDAEGALTPLANTLLEQWTARLRAVADDLERYA